MKTYKIDIVKLPKSMAGTLSEAVVDEETGQVAFVVGEDTEFAERLIGFMNRMERIQNKVEEKA
jgi:hypothetical protein